MSSFSPAVAIVLQNEGSGYNPNDAPVGSKYGITGDAYETAYGTDATEAEIQALTAGQATDIYNAVYWNPSNIAEITDQGTANQLFDIYINLGEGNAFGVVEKALNDTGYSITSISWDEEVIDQLNAAIAAGQTQALNNNLVNERISYYNGLVSENSAYSADLQGWINRAKTFAPGSVSGTTIGVGIAVAAVAAVAALLLL